MRNIQIFDEFGTVVVVLNGEKTVITSCKKFTNFEVMGKFADSYSIQHMYRKEDITKAYTDAGDVFGCAVGHVTKMLNGAINRVLINPNYELIKRLGYHKGVFSCMLADTVIQNKDVIQQYIDDGQPHMAAYALIWGNAAECKKVCGKGLWKSLCKNSMTRNDSIAKTMWSFGNYPGKAQACKFLQAIPSSLLKFGEIISYYKQGTNLAKAIVENLDGPMYKAKPEDVMRICNMTADCARMLGTRFNKNWSFTRIVREHKQEVRRLRDLQYTDDNFPYYDLLPTTISNKDNGYTAELVRSPRQLANLGEEHRHCVGLYSNNCWNGLYVVYRIIDTEGTVSTLGFSVGTAILPNQHYLAFNEPIANYTRKDLGNYVKSHITQEVSNMIDAGTWVKTTCGSVQAIPNAVQAPMPDDPF